MRSDLIAMSPKEIGRLECLQLLAQGTIRQAEAARKLGLTVRQIKRLVRAYRSGGAAAIVSKRRGRPGNRRRDPELIRNAVQLVREHYADFGPTLASEMLAERHQICIDRETLRTHLIEAGIWIAKVRKHRYHPPRERRAQFGELIQIDGSPHSWFEDRGPRCTLLVFIDDATSRLVGLRFVRTESTTAYLQLAYDYFRTFGLPQALYSDRHSIFRINTKKPTERDVTDFGKAIDALNIELICAKSPQAKGRVERVNRTLQDRLTKELRVAGIDSIEHANAYLHGDYLERHNARFAVSPRDPHDAHRTLPQDIDLRNIMARRQQRKLSQQLTFSCGKTIYQILTTERRLVFPKATIELIETLDGELVVQRNGQTLPYEAVRERPKLPQILDAKQLADHPRKPPQKPSPDHPWKSRGLCSALGIAHPRDISNLQAGDITDLR
jgi:transposase